MYTVPQPGYIVIRDCVTNRDYNVYVNSGWVYHKCYTTRGSFGTFAVNAGDVIEIRIAIPATTEDWNHELSDTDNIYGSWISFAPLKQ